MEGHMLIAAVYEEVRRMRMTLRVTRRSLRDHNNPFDVPDIEFIRLYRIPKEGVQHIIEEIADFLPPTRRCTAIPPHIRVLATLNFLASGSYQRRVGQDFLHALSQSSASICITYTCNAITTILLNKWIKFPKTAVEIDRVRQRFMEKTNMPGVIGAIDGTHIAIVPPTTAREHSFINRKNFHSKNVQIVSDYDLRILSLNARHGGRVHDAQIWRASLLRDYLHQGHILEQRWKWLIGDAGYPNEPWLLTAINHAVPETPEARFNKSHRSARNCVERCIGVLKGWFRCLKQDRTLHYTPERAGFIISTCAVLHNMALYYRVPLPQNIQLEAEEIIGVVGGDINIAREGNNVRRSVVTNHFS